MKITSRIDNLNYGNYKTEKKADTYKENEKLGFKKGLAALLVGEVTSSTIQTAYQISSGNYIAKLMQKFGKAEGDMSNILTQSLEKSKLAEKGVEIKDISKMSNIAVATAGGEKIIQTVDKQIGLLLMNELKEGSVRKYLFKAISKNPQIAQQVDNFITNIYSPMFKNGKNAAFFPNTHKILINSEKLGLAVFHEMGHAINKNMSNAGKLLQRMRSVSLAAPIFFAVAMLTNKRTAENPPQTKWQKTKNFIKENIGKISTLCFMPMVAEEIMASVRGQKLAKSVVPKELIKNVNKTHMVGAASYIGAAVIAGLAAFLANKVRDKVICQKPNA